MSTTDSKRLLYDFSSTNNVNDWYTINDGVMGGVSDGSFYLEEETGVFEGKVRLENNGGFASVRHRLNVNGVNRDYILRIRLKGDGKKYQVRIKHETSSYYSYIYTFATSGEWETIEVPLKKMYPSYRGRKLDMSTFDKDEIEELGFLIGNNRAEEFRLLLNTIWLAAE